MRRFFIPFASFCKVLVSTLPRPVSRTLAFKLPASLQT